MRIVPALVIGLLGLAGPGNAAQVAQTVDYLRDIKPIFKAHCYACHGALRQKSGLRLDAAELIRKGGNSGLAIVPGKSEESLLIDAVMGRNDTKRMPPKEEGAPLSAPQIALLKAWIDQGARAPNEAVPEDPRKHWSFRRPVRPALPRAADPAWTRNPIDRFIAAQQEKHGLRAAAPASQETLLRRVYLDLTGLPPTRADLHAFLADTSDHAYEKVVDRLLTSPRYGERWARHWMDVWRYSDWYGRRAVPDVWNSAPQIWRWRDWIVKSLNADKGYDRMIVEMLAADEVAPEDQEAVVATGYIVRNWYALNYNQWVRDMVEHTGKAFLGLTMNCAHCHDHKYDPISQKEYFQLRAFFEPIELRQDRVRGEADPGPFQKYSYSVLRKIVRAGAVRVFDERLDAKTYMYRGGDERVRFQGRPPVSPAAPAFLGGDKIKIAPVDLSPAAYYPGSKTFIQQEEIAKATKSVLAARAAVLHQPEASARTADLAQTRLAVAEASLEAIKARIAADNVKYNKTPGDFTTLAQAASRAERVLAFRVALEKQVLAERALAVAPLAKKKSAEQQATQARQAVEAARKALALTSTTYTPLSPIYPTKSTGRRTALARWIADKKNPLTARVAVNHIWMRHFGKPLVETVFDFGRNGKRPTHPELLDWLAVELMESGWSMKQLHRRIVTSRAYRMQSAASDSRNLARDRDNRWLWHFEGRRLEGEVVRDSTLYVSGQLDLKMGGQELENDKDAASHRRSLYFSIHPENGGHLDMLDLFDAPDPCDCYRRSESIVPQQALALTNSRLALSQSRLLAHALWTEIVGAQKNEKLREPAFIKAAFEQMLSRLPTVAENDVCLDFLSRQAELFRKVGPMPLSVKAAATEPPSADPAMRARESLVRALFSHNDFVTMR
jgi:mono/diheme cytochrome c family protein